MVAGQGEALADALAAGGDMVAALERNGFPAEDAVRNSFVPPGNARRLLDRYRSAVDLARIVVPSMLLWGERDLIVPIEIGRRMAARIGAEMVPLPAGHFWPYEVPDQAAAALQRLWSRAELRPHTILTQPSLAG